MARQSRPAISIALISLALVLAACQHATVPAPVAPSALVGGLTARLKTEADELATSGAWDRAVVKYRVALSEAPADVSIRYGLAVALSHVDEHAEAGEHFAVVVSRGAPESSEVRVARDWLASAGFDGAAVAVRDATELRGDTKGRVTGAVQWQEIDPHAQLVRVRISLAGADPANRDVEMTREFTVGRAYDFRRVPPGAYVVTADVAGTRLWEQKVTVADGTTVLDLTERNSLVSPAELHLAAGD